MSTFCFFLQATSRLKSSALSHGDRLYCRLTCTKPNTMKQENNKMFAMGLTRRSFVKTGAGAVVAASLLPVLNRHAVALGEHAGAGTTSPIYVCTPCGLDCDKLEFDKPGKCPSCGMP